ncbi:MAG: hypothetical protein HOQ36_09290 [Nocardia sp.]|nr:hypothetical protein [Nocardia sp.]NUS92591.1 hypothetical protein [Nocardia sp.]
MTTGVEQPPDPGRRTADPARWRRSAGLSLLAMVITPVALGIAANGAVTGRALAISTPAGGDPSAPQPFTHST